MQMAKAKKGGRKGGRAASRKKQKAGSAMNAQAPNAPSQTVQPMVDDVPQKPSDELAVIVGKHPISLRDANRIVLHYVQRKGLQDKEDARMVTVKAGANEPLQDVVGKRSFSLIEMTQALRRNLT
jgi:chromatin remodeling complex protein RSC6